MEMEKKTAKISNLRKMHTMFIIIPYCNDIHLEFQSTWRTLISTLLIALMTHCCSDYFFKNTESTSNILVTLMGVTQYLIEFYRGIHRSVMYSLLSFEILCQCNFTISRCVSYFRMPI